MKKYIDKPKAKPVIPIGSYEQYNLRENPFPSSAFVNPESSDVRTNGAIYEPSIRQAESDRFRQNFLEAAQNDPNHLRLGYIMDTSYVGRGNGKSAFILNLQKQINDDFALSISNEVNKCFAITLVPAPSGKTKTFENFVDLFAKMIFRSGIIEDAVITLRLEAILALTEDFKVEDHFENENDLRNKLNSHDWYKEVKIDFWKVNKNLLTAPYLQNLPPDFPLVSSAMSFFPPVSNYDAFVEYYENLRRGEPKTEFVFSHLVNLFMAAGFNGAYIFVDDFERIPDFQSERQKRDFAVELRSCLFDGLYMNAKVGFYDFILILHAGVPRLIQSAWDQSGMEHRVPVFYKGGIPKHVIRFEKITLDQTFPLLLKYLDNYRIKSTDTEDISPFTKDAVSKMAELNEFNAAKILKMAHEVLERASKQNILQIDVNFILHEEDEIVALEQEKISGIHDAPTKNLVQEAE